MSRVIIYARVSTEEQTRPGYNSLDMQEDTARKHVSHMAEVAGVPCPEVSLYREEGASGKSLERPLLKLLRAEVERGGVSAVVVYKLDRLTRSLHDFLNLDAEFQRHGTGVISVREQFDTTTPMGRALRSLLLIFAELERETIVQRVKDKHTALLETGRYAGGSRPYGYRSEKGKGLTIVPEQAAVVRRIFDAYTREGLTTMAIARALNTEAVPTARGGDWTSETIRGILQAPHHRGLQVFGDRVVPWPYEPIVAPATAEAAHARLESNRKRKGRNAVQWEWRGVLVCPSCGWAYTRYTDNKVQGKARKMYHYIRYQCSRKSKCSERAEPPCPTPTLRARELDGMTALLLEAVRNSQPAPRPEPSPDLARRLAAITERKRRAQVAFLDQKVSFLSEDQYRAIMAECDAEEAEITPPAMLDVDGQTLAESWDELTTLERNAAIKSLVHRAVAYNDRVELELRPTGWLNWPVRLTYPL